MSFWSILVQYQLSSLILFCMEAHAKFYMTFTPVDKIVKNGHSFDSLYFHLSRGSGAQRLTD